MKATNLATPTPTPTPTATPTSSSVDKPSPMQPEKKKKKKKPFKVVGALKMPPEMSRLINSIKMPMEQVQNMIQAEEIEAAEEEASKPVFHSLTM